MTEAEQPTIQIPTASQTFEGHEDNVFAVAVFPDGRRMVTASADMTLRLWDLEDNIVLKEMEGHGNWVRTIAVSRDGKFIASGDDGGELIAWNGDGESLTKPIKVHFRDIYSLDLSPDNTSLASGSFDTTTILWNTKTWQVQGNPIGCRAEVHCVRYSPSGELLAIGTRTNIQIWNLDKRERIAKFRGHAAWNYSLTWMLDGKQLVSAGIHGDPTIRTWDSSTWMPVGEPWKGHNQAIWMIALNPAGTLLASASDDHQVRIWRVSDRRTIAILKHTSYVYCVTFSMDGKYILSGGRDNMISKWAVPLLEDFLEDQTSNVRFCSFTISLHIGPQA
jgi:WD40 repeat protein